MKKIFILIFIPYLLFSNNVQGLKVKGDSNFIVQIFHKGLSSETVIKLMKPFQDRVSALENKIERTVSIEVKYKLMVELTEAKELFALKNREIGELNRFIKKSNLKIIKIVTKIYEEKGLTATLDYFKSKEFIPFEDATEQKMKKLANSQLLKAKIFRINNKYLLAKKAYKKALTYDYSIDTLIIYADFLEEQGYREEAILIFNKLLKEQKKLAQNNPSLYDIEVSKTLESLGYLYFNNNDFIEAEEVLKESLDIRRKLAEINPSIYMVMLGGALSNLANVYDGNQDLHKALHLYNDALVIHREVGKNQPNIYNIGMTLANLMRVYKKQGRLNFFKKHYQESLSMYQSLIEMKYRVDSKFINALNLFAGIYREISEEKKAEALYLKALKLSKKKAKENKDMYTPLIAETLNNLINFYHHINDLDKQKALYVELLKVQKSLVKRNPYLYNANLARTLNDMSLFYINIEELTKAQQIYKESNNLYQVLYKENQNQYGLDFVSNLILGVAYLNKDVIHLNQAKQILESFSDNPKSEKLLSLIHNLYAKHKSTMLLDKELKTEAEYNNLGIQYYSIGQYEKARVQYRKAIEINPNSYVAYYNIGSTYMKELDYVNADKAYLQSIAINPQYYQSYFKRGNLFIYQKKYHQAIELYNKAIGLNPMYEDAYMNLAIALLNIEEIEKALDAFRKILKINPNNHQASQVMQKILDDKKYQ